jgi:uncharacterized membrane protein
MRLGPLPIIVVLALVFLLPLLFGELMVTSLARLQLSPGTALALFISIILGGMINLPIRKLGAADGRQSHPLAAYRLQHVTPGLWRTRRDSILAVNVGGCVIPLLIVAYEVSLLAANNRQALVIATLVSAINVWVCYRIARPVPKIGIMMPALVSPLVAALLAMFLAPGDSAPAVAFTAGVLGPLIGADLFHLKDFERSGAAIVSIGGAGTFDGIVLSGILAAYLA